MKIQHALLLLSLCAVSACGFSLRGTASLPAAMQPLYLEGLEDDSDILREVRRTLNNNDVQLSSAVVPMQYRLGIGREQRTERVVSVNVNARAGEYELSMTVPFQLRLGSELVMGPERLTVSRVYLADPENVVAKNREAEQIQKEMRQDLSQQIVRRLQALPL